MGFWFEHEEMACHFFMCDYELLENFLRLAGKCVKMAVGGDWMETVRTVTADVAPLCNEEHDLEKEKREGLDYVDHDRTGDNVTFEYRPLKELYQEQFRDAVEAYNAKQTRQERRKSVEGYLRDLERNTDAYKKMTPKERTQDSSVKSRYELLLYVGDRNDTGYDVDPAAAKLAEEILTEYVQGFKKRNPCLKVQYSYMHKDEATPHAGIVFVPVADGYKRGLGRQVSMSKALAQQGFPDKRGEVGFEKWVKAERAELRRLAERRGMSIIEKNDPKREKLTRSEYISQQKAIEREATRQLQEASKEKLRPMKKAEKGLLGYKDADYERLWKEYQKVGFRCFAAEELNRKMGVHDVKHALEAAEKSRQQLGEAVEMLERSEQDLETERRRADGLQASLDAVIDTLDEAGALRAVKALEGMPGQEKADARRRKVQLTEGHRRMFEERERKKTQEKGKGKSM